MVDPESITALSDSIVQSFAPERIILFGSYAYGIPTEESDVDILVIMNYEGQSVRKAIEILQTVKPHMPLDLIVRSSEEVRQRLIWNDFFLREIMEKGKVLYESPHGRMG